MVAPALDEGFNGEWSKDGGRSSPMNDALAVMAIGGLMRQAMRLVRGCNIAIEGEKLTIDITSVIGWFKIRENFLLSGETTENKRRDMRGGQARCKATPVAADHFRLNFEFDDPHGGTCNDEFTLTSKDELTTVTTVTNTKGESATFTQVYKRRGT